MVRGIYRQEVSLLLGCHETCSGVPPPPDLRLLTQSLFTSILCITRRGSGKFLAFNDQCVFHFISRCLYSRNVFGIISYVLPFKLLSICISNGIRMVMIHRRTIH